MSPDHSFQEHEDKRSRIPNETNHSWLLRKYTKTVFRFRPYSIPAGSGSSIVLYHIADELNPRETPKSMRIQIGICRQTESKIFTFRLSFFTNEYIF
jgi:hypothetical protein